MRNGEGARSKGIEGKLPISRFPFFPFPPLKLNGITEFPFFPEVRCVAQPIVGVNRAKAQALECPWRRAGLVESWPPPYSRIPAAATRGPVRHCCGLQALQFLSIPVSATACSLSHDNVGHRQWGTRQRLGPACLLLNGAIRLATTRNPVRLHFLLANGKTIS